VAKDRRHGATRAGAFHRISKELLRELPAIIRILELQRKDFNRPRRYQELTVKARQPIVLLPLTLLCTAARRAEVKEEISVSVEEFTAAQKLFQIIRRLPLAIQ